MMLQTPDHDLFDDYINSQDVALPRSGGAYAGLRGVLPLLFSTPLCVLLLASSAGIGHIIRERLGEGPMPALTTLFFDPTDTLDGQWCVPPTDAAGLMAGLCLFLAASAGLLALTPARRLASWSGAFVLLTHVAVLLLYAWAITKPFIGG